MYLFLTQCFASKVGGIENLMTNFAISLAKFDEVNVFADSHFFIQDKIFDLEHKKTLKIFRYGGLKFFRRYKKAKDVKLIIKNNDNININGIISDTWKSLELCIDEIDKKKIPVMCLAHGNELIYKNDNKKNRLTKTLSKVNMIVANSNYTADLLTKLKINKNKIFVVNPGATDLRFLKSKKTYDFKGSPILLTLARLEKRKGHEKVIKIFNKLKKDFPNIIYLIAGNGPEKKYLENLVKKYNLSESVFFIGTINDFQKKEIFELSTLHVMPTTNESESGSIEGFGISFIEAAMFGLTSIATDVGGTSDAIINNNTGILLKNDDDFYLIIRDLLKNKAELLRLGNNAKARANKEFNWDKVVKNYLQIFESN